jgi:DNA-binding IclR family transcriptional regulator
VEGTNDVHAAPRLGETTLLESSTAGRAILAFAERDLVSRYLSWTKKKSGTKMPPDAAAIRKQGYALDTAEDRFELAVPVVDADGEVIAAITLEAGDASKESTRIARTRAAAKQLEKLLVERPELAFDPFGHLPLEERYPGFDPVGS